MARSSRRRRKNGFAGRVAATLARVRDAASSRAGRLATGAAWTAGVAGLATAWVLGVPPLRAAVAEANAAPRVGVEFVGLPAWVNGDLLAMLDVTARQPLQGRPFTRAPLAEARRSLLETGWFDEIAQIRRVRPDLVTIHATFVTPAAVVRDVNGDHLVDPHGRLLPHTYPAGSARHLLAVTGVNFDRPPRPGLQWEGADVIAALRLLRLVGEKPWRGQIAAIDAESYLAEETLVIVTDRGARIVWGSAPGEESGLEVPAEGKLAYLDTAFEEFRRIDTGHTGTLHFYERGYFAE